MAKNRRRRILHDPNWQTLNRQLEQAFEQQNPGPRAVSELSTDEQAAAHLHRGNFGTHTGEVVFGRITFAAPYLHWYRVALDDASADFPCCALTDSAATPFSTRSNIPLSPGCSVMVFRPPEGFYGYIIGVVPEIVSDGSLVHPDWISQGSNMGFKRELYYHGILSLFAEKGSMIDFSNSRPVDSGSIGEWGRMNDLGGGIHIDPFLLFFRVNETCGLFLNYLDDLARLEGYNLDIRTACSEVISRNDSGESMHYSGFSPYSWEALGSYFPSNPTHREVSDADVQYNQPYGKIEPLVDDQQPFYRLEEFRGYLGQAFMRQVLLPPEVTSGATVQQYQSQLSIPGVFREQIGMDGSYGVSSAHSIVLAKRSLIPAGKRLKPVEAVDGDNIDNSESTYSFAGQLGGSVQHQIGDVDPGSDRENLIRAVGMEDYLSHLFNWKGLHPFHYHVRDFYLPEQSEMSPLTTLQQIPSFSSLFTQTWLDPVSPKPQFVDSRYDNVDYYEVQSSFALLPDGSSVWRGGGGEEIRFMGGNIQISCPGDIMLQPGRSVVAYGGDDIILKANKSVDITANKNDVRLKAERNLEILGGNSGVGRVLIETKSEFLPHEYEKKIGEDIDGSGILFKAGKSQIVGWAEEIYLRTGGGDVNGGPIVLDADQGQQDISTVSRVFTRHIDSYAGDFFGAGTSKQTANTFTAQNTQFQTACQFDGGVYITNNGLVMRGNLAIVGGHIGTENAADYNYMVGGYREASLKKLEAAILQVQTDMQKTRQIAEQDYAKSIDLRYYDIGLVGEDSTITNTGFSLRNEEQYSTENWELPETYWQQMLREAELGDSVGVYEDNPVDYQDGSQQLSPHPGYDKWREPTWLTLSLTMHDYKTGLNNDRGTPETGGSQNDYESPQFGAWERIEPDSNYPVIS